MPHWLPEQILDKKHSWHSHSWQVSCSWVWLRIIQKHPWHKQTSQNNLPAHRYSALQKSFPWELYGCPSQAPENRTQKMSSFVSYAECFTVNFKAKQGSQTNCSTQTAPHSLKTSLRVTTDYVKVCISTGHIRFCGCWCSQWLHPVKRSNPLPLSQHFWSWQTEVLWTQYVIYLQCFLISPLSQVGYWGWISRVSFSDRSD